MEMIEEFPTIYKIHYKMNIVFCLNTLKQTKFNQKESVIPYNIIYDLFDFWIMEDPEGVN